MSAGTNRIVVATQVVEAGVDFSAALLFTDLALGESGAASRPRGALGRQGEVVVVDTAPKTMVPQRLIRWMNWRLLGQHSRN